MNRKKLIESLISIIVGIGIFLFVFRNFDTSTFGSQIRLFNFWWLGLAFLINISSQLVRAIRWKKIFTTMDLYPTTWTLFVSIITLGMTNQIIPRGGEVARIIFIQKSEGIAPAKVIGITLVERLSDMVLLFIILIILIITNVPFLNTLFDQTAITFIKPYKALIAGPLITVIILSIIGLFILRRNHKKVEKIITDISEGFKTLKKMDGKAIYCIQSVLIYLLWFLMSYIHFKAFSSTSNLSMHDAVLTFGFASLAFLVPVQGGIGAWHFVVIQIMLILGISASDAEMFAMVAHGSMNTIFIPIGILIFILWMLFQNKAHKHNQKNGTIISFSIAQ